MSEPQASKALPLLALVARVLTLILLLASLIIIAVDTATIGSDLNNVKIRFRNVYAYRYVLSTIVIGLAYTLLQIPFAIHHVSLGKRLVDHDALLKFDFYGDKVLLSFLATRVGAAFGATLDLKKNMDELPTLLQQTCFFPGLQELASALDTFFNRAYVSASLLLLGFLFSVVSSIISSLSLAKKV